MVFRPLSQRNNPDPAFEGPHDGIPPWLSHSLEGWLERLLLDGDYPDESKLHDLEASLHLDPPLSWHNGASSALRSVFAYFENDDDFALDALDWGLALCEPGSIYVMELDRILVQGGSAWETHANSDESGCQLVRRVVGPVAEAIEDIRPTSQRAHAHLVSAWSKLMGRNPDPSGAYREAIRAVEVVAAPVVAPNDTLVTLGKIIGTLRANPEKWTVDLAEATTQQVTEMAAMIWQSQVDRHGTDDESVPLNVSQEQADAAVHISIALVRLFAGGHITRVP
jgi:hypothetical protein